MKIEIFAPKELKRLCHQFQKLINERGWEDSGLHDDVYGITLDGGFTPLGTDPELAGMAASMQKEFIWAFAVVNTTKIKGGKSYSVVFISPHCKYAGHLLSGGIICNQTEDSLTCNMREPTVFPIQDIAKANAASLVLVYTALSMTSNRVVNKALFGKQS